MTLGDIIREYLETNTMTDFSRESGISRAYAYFGSMMPQVRILSSRYIGNARKTAESSGKPGFFYALQSNLF